MQLYSYVNYILYRRYIIVLVTTSTVRSQGRTAHIASNPAGAPDDVVVYGALAMPRFRIVNGLPVRMVQCHGMRLPMLAAGADAST